MTNRVVVTGYNVLLPEVHNLEEFHNFLVRGIPCYDFHEDLKEDGFFCQVGGRIKDIDHLLKEVTDDLELVEASLNTKMGIVSAFHAWQNAGLSIPSNKTRDPDTGVIVGSSTGSLNMMAEKVYPSIQKKRIKRIGSFGAQNIMNSNVSAHLSAMINAGGLTLGLSNACSSSTDAIIQGYHHIRQGRAKRFLVGGVEESSKYVWSLFDALMVSNRHSNQSPKEACRPFSAEAKGVIPSGGAAMIVIESLDSAKERGAHIYAEIKGTHQNSGAQQSGGSMTYPNKDAIIRCIHKAIEHAEINASEIQLINGHLTGTKADILEVGCWKEAFKMNDAALPFIQSTKGLVGHTIGAAGAVEVCALLDQMSKDYIHGNTNCKPIHSDILEQVDEDKISTTKIDTKLDTVIKASFGFGDVNSVLILGKV